MKEFNNNPAHSARYIDLKSDFGFRKIFGNPMHKEFLIDLLRCLIPERTIKDLVYLDTDQLGPASDSRDAVFDVRCISDDGSEFVVEMQRRNQDWFMERTLFYSSFIIQEQLAKGGGSFKMNPIYVVGILDFKLPHKGENRRPADTSEEADNVALNCISDRKESLKGYGDAIMESQGQSSGHKEVQPSGYDEVLLSGCKEVQPSDSEARPLGENCSSQCRSYEVENDYLVSRYDIRNRRHPQELMTDSLHFVFLELGRFAKEKNELETDLDRWCFALKRMQNLDKRPLEFQREIYRRLFDAAEVARMPKEERTKYELHMDTKEDIRRQIEFAAKEARSEGKAEGIAESMRRFAENLRTLGLSEEQIAMATRMPEADL